MCCLPFIQASRYLSNWVPPHVSLLQSISKIAAEITRIVPAVDDIVPLVVQGVVSSLDERQINNGTLTKAAVATIVTECLRASGILDAVGRLNATTQEGSVPISSPLESTELVYESFCWGGMFHPVPKKFSLPKCGLLHAWQHWCLGDSARRIAPLKNIHPRDLCQTNTKKRFADL